MEFLQKIKSSIYDPEFYRNISKKPFSEAIKYYLLFCLLVTIFRIVFLVFPTITMVNAMTQRINTFITTYPKTLEIKLHQGKLTINQPQPYTIPLCDESSTCDNIVIDTQNPNINAYAKQKNVLLLLTKDTAFFQQTNGDIRGYSLAKIGNLRINKQIVTAFVAQISPWIKMSIPILLLFAGIAYYSSYLLTLVYLFFLALLLWLLAKKFAPKMTYSESYKVALHMVTLGIIVTLLLDVTGWFLHISPFPFMETMISLLVFTFNRNTAGTKMPKQPTKPKK